MKFFLFFVISLFVASVVFAAQITQEDPKKAASQGYEREFIELVELVYGKGFLSQGGPESVEQLVQGLDLQSKKILDIGSGLGGPAIHLAKTYDVEVVGIDPQEWMIELSNKNLEEAKHELKGSVSFVLMQDPSNLKQFHDNSFDFIISKEAMLHVPIELKKHFFSEIHRILKPSGEIVIMDWVHNSSNYSENTQKMMELDGVAYNLITPKECENILQEVGFSNVKVKNTSEESTMLSQENIDTVKRHKQQIEKQYGSDVYEYCIESWGYQRDAFTNEELLTAVFTGKK